VHLVCTNPCLWRSRRAGEKWVVSDRGPRARGAAGVKMTALRGEAANEWLAAWVASGGCIQGNAPIGEGGTAASTLGAHEGAGNEKQPSAEGGSNVRRGNGRDGSSSAPRARPTDRAVFESTCPEPRILRRAARTRTAPRTD
jgi:hypothetical protein